MYRVAIVEDEEEFREQLQLYLKQHQVKLTRVIIKLKSLKTKQMQIQFLQK